MALETTLHENPFDELVWEKRNPISCSKHRSRACENLKGINTIVVKDDGDDKEDYSKDYCMLAATTKDPKHIRPVVITGRDGHYSTAVYNTFARTHTSGPLYVDSTKQTTISTNQQSYGRDIPVTNEEDVQLFCCNRDVDCLIDYATCMCCVKGALYHCTKDSYDEGMMSEGPCSCDDDTSTRSCVSRWACMFVASIFLPCLLCYPPAKGCTHVCKSYKQHRTAKRSRGRMRTSRS